MSAAVVKVAMGGALVGAAMRPLLTVGQEREPCDVYADMAMGAVLAVALLVLAGAAKRCGAAQKANKGNDL